MSRFLWIGLCYYDLKTFSSQTLSMGIKTMRNFTLILKLFDRNVKNLLTKKFFAKMCAKLEFVLSFTTKFQKFLANNVFWVHFSQLFPQIWNQRKIMHIFYPQMQKRKLKNFEFIEYMYEYFLELGKCKFAKIAQPIEKTSWTNIFKNIVWHLLCWWVLSSCKNHCSLLAE